MSPDTESPTKKDDVSPRRLYASVIELAPLLLFFIVKTNDGCRLVILILVLVHDVHCIVRHHS